MIIRKGADTSGTIGVGKTRIQFVVSSDKEVLREAFVDDGILKRCTPREWNEWPALPQAELNLRKATLFHQFSRFWTCLEEFEHKWTAAQESIAQVYNRLRKL